MTDEVLTDSAESTPEPTPEVTVTATRSISERIRDVEFRWGKSMEHVMLDLHDHVFGKSPEVPSAPPIPVTDPEPK